MIYNEFIRVLIVDDAYLIREDIKSLFDWKKFGFEIIGEASNGYQGIEQYRKLEPDLVITDIRMPVMNGLDMIDQLLCKNEHTEFILLTAYEDFEYARKAIKLDVSNYILKHEIREEIFKNILHKIKERILDKKQQLQQIHNKTIKDILLDKVESNQLNSILKYYLSNNNERNYAFLIIHYPYIKNSSVPIKRIVNDAIKEFSCDINIICQFENTPYYVICITNKNATKKIDNIFNMILAQKILKSHIEITNKPLSIAISKCESDANQFAIIYMETYDKIICDYFFDISKHIVYSWQYRSTIFEKGKVEEVLALFAENLQRSNILIAINNLKTLNCICYDSNNIECFNFIREKINPILFKYTNLELGYDEGILGIGNTANDFFKQVEEAIIKSYSYNNHIISMKIRETLKYINTNIGKGITLGDIASRMNLSVIYTGQLFKKEMGISFNKYLVHIRIEKAKTFLKSGDYKIYEISEMVGYQTVQYFSNVFKKTTGVNPKDYC